MLTLRNLVKAYPGGRDSDRQLVLDRVSLDVPTGQFVCIVGPSGCGKTTLIRMVAGITEVDAGSIAIDGREVRGPGQDRALVFQSYGLLPWRSVLGNVELGLEIQGVDKSERRQVASRCIEMVGLAGTERLYPHQLSGGMQQRVGIARALTKRPRVMLMDEPFAAVDMQTREDLQEQLGQIWQRDPMTVMFVTHSVDEAVFMADRVVVMAARPGRIVDDVAIPLPRPRDAAHARSSAQFGELAARIRNNLRHDEKPGAP